ncbi:chloramphenicol phosphotransferase CPT family protein [Photobacterium sp.]|uniref:chloramphenicol phosphotransferase CPT family protein n=1 Tax=Photobacterium sp. TaxID=660 RepID=UPI00299CED27|nr:chloramphenicol phosphotransferase CPT family protein [Photobacterium sp.]MDX1304670.1 chloramphenicol phosphotransferase CPT family protein [Photobacterium sp.]
MAKMIFLHGTSSSGKSTLSKAIQKQSAIPFWHFSSDQFVEAGMLPKRVNDGGSFDWSKHRPLFFDAFHSCIKAVADSGNNLILDHIIESEEWFHYLQELLSNHDVFFVGIHCPIEILREREMKRGDKDIGNRYFGESEYHFKHVHTYSAYDYEIDTSKQSTAKSAEMVLSAWEQRAESVFFDKAANS